MKIQAINTAHGFTGNIAKPGKLTNLAYSAVFATSLLTAADTFVASKAQDKEVPKTELQTKAGYDNDKLEELRKRVQANAERMEKEFNNKSEADEMSFMDYVIAIAAGAFIGGAARSVSNSLKEG